VPRAAAPPSPRIGMVCATRTSDDGILDYAQNLGTALATLHCLDVDIVVQARDGWSIRRLGPGRGPQRRARSLDEALAHVDALILHYNPFSWGSRGFAPYLVPMLGRLRRRKPRVVVGILAHERYVDMHGLRWTMMGGWQRVQFLAILRFADVAWSSIEAWTESLHAQTRARVAQIPICSNLPDRRGARLLARARLGIDGSALVVAAFGTDHPSRLIGHIEGAVDAIAGSGRPVTLLNLGAGAPPVAVHAAGVTVVAPGRLHASAVAEHMAAADLYLAPFVDGVSARRTTLMAALQHALPVVGTDGPLTDTVLRDAHEALMLAPSTDRAAFVAAARDLASDGDQRARRGAAARRLYEARFDWPVACRVALSGLTERGDRRRA
jgi:glycosyltransferase involved in cell wall biosynthesis